MSIILNKEELAINESRKNALDILETGLEAIDTEKILRKKITFNDGVLCVDGMDFQCSFYERIFFIGIGKCALKGARIIENILGNCLTDGIALDIKIGELKKIKSYAGTHPYPSEQNVEITKKILEMVKGVTEKDLIITLISGGGSSLFELPVPGITLDTIIKKTKELTAKGADIYELNAVRKNLSEVKGGKFAKLCYPAQIVSLVFSDVLGNDISTVASGPTVLDVSDDRIKNILMVSNRNALEAMKTKSEELGFNTTIETETLSGNTSEIGKELAMRKLKPKTCVLFGGETTVKIRGDGIGGRNQEMALSALPYIQPNSVLVCAASDGWDNTDHAGAIADQELSQKAKNLEINPKEYLEKNDSYNFFKKVADGAISTGKLGSNVSDLCILIYNG